MRGANHRFHIFIKHHYSSNSFFGETIYSEYLLNLSSMYGINCLGEIYKQKCCLKIFCTFFFNDSIDCENMWDCTLISQKAILIFPENFFHFRSAIIEKQSIINNCYSSKSSASVVLSDSKVTLLGKRFHLFFFHFSFMFCLYTMLHNLRSMLKNFFVFHTSESILSRPTVFLQLIFQVLSPKTVLVWCLVGY